jgi:hypothetical protein
VCGIILFRAIIVLLVAVGVILVVGTCCTSVVSAVPICTSLSLWALTSGIRAQVRWYSDVVRLSGAVLI